MGQFDDLVTVPERCTSIQHALKLRLELAVGRKSLLELTVALNSDRLSLPFNSN